MINFFQVIFESPDTMQRKSSGNPAVFSKYIVSSILPLYAGIQHWFSYHIVPLLHWFQSENTVEDAVLWNTQISQMYPDMRALPPDIQNHCHSCENISFPVPADEQPEMTDVHPVYACEAVFQ